MTYATLQLGVDGLLELFVHRMPAVNVVVRYVRNLAFGILLATNPQTSCNLRSIQSFLPANATVFYASHYEAGDLFTPPAHLNQGEAMLGRLQPIPLPRAGCLVQANVTLSNNTQYSMGLVLPDAWNERFLAVGNGGFAGSVRWTEIIDVMYYGFAATSTNTGHEGPTAAFAYQNEQALVTWAHVALHDTVTRAKNVVETYYNSVIRYSYFRGCSAGGRQGLKEVQLYPEDFDGVVVGAPTWWTTRVQLWKIVVGIWNFPANASHRVNPSMFELINDEVIRQCDPQDGVKDNIIMEPHLCEFDPEALLCAANAIDTTGCLSHSQVNTLTRLWHDWTEAETGFVFPSFMLGAEWNWNALVASPSDLAVGYIKYMLQEGPEWTWEDWKSDYISLSDWLNPGNANADDFDLSPFFRRGGRVIMYHGYSDGSVPPGSSIYFYEEVAKVMDQRNLDLNDFFRLYLIPGLGHCWGTTSAMNAPWYIGGDSQQCSIKYDNDTSIHGVPGHEDPKHDVMLAIMDWVENGVTPDSIVATKWKDDRVSSGVERQRPICPYPKRAVYRGGGDLDDAESWHCTL